MGLPLSPALSHGGRYVQGSGRRMRISRINKISRDICKSLLIVAVLGSEFLLVTAVADEMPMESESNKTTTMAPMKNNSMQGGRAPEDARDPDAYSGGYEYRGMGGWEETDEIVFSKIGIAHV